MTIILEEVLLVLVIGFIGFFIIPLIIAGIATALILKYDKKDRLYNFITNHD